MWSSTRRQVPSRSSPSTCARNTAPRRGPAAGVLRRGIIQRHRDELDIFHGTLQQRRQRHRRGPAVDGRACAAISKNGGDHQGRTSTSPAAPTRTAAAATAPRPPRTTGRKGRVDAWRRPRDHREGQPDHRPAAGRPRRPLHVPQFFLDPVIHEPISRATTLPSFTLRSRLAARPKRCRAENSPHSAPARPILARHVSYCGHPRRTGPLTGAELAAAGGFTDILELWRDCHASGLVLRRTGRRYMRLDSAVDRLCPPVALHPPRIPHLHPRRPRQPGRTVLAARAAELERRPPPSRARRSTSPAKASAWPFRAFPTNPSILREWPS